MSSAERNRRKSGDPALMQVKSAAAIFTNEVHHFAGRGPEQPFTEAASLALTMLATWAAETMGTPEEEIQASVRGLLIGALVASIASEGGPDAVDDAATAMVRRLVAAVPVGVEAIRSRREAML